MKNLFNILNHEAEIFFKSILSSINSHSELALSYSSYADHKDENHFNGVVIDYDTVDFINDLTTKNENYISIESNYALAEVTISTKTSGELFLINSNGIELEKLNRGKSSLDKYSIGEYYIAIKDYKNQLVALKPFYNIK